MKFTFEADMKKGQCFHCPCHIVEGDYDRCGVDGEMSFGLVEELDCPLEEANEVVWHPYPQEKPTDEYGYYLVTIADCKVHEGVWNRRFYWDDSGDEEFEIDYVTAWAEMPKPYVKSS